MQKPKSQIQQVLLDLIQNKETTEEQRGYHAFRHFVSILKRSLSIKHIDKKFINSFGRKSWYRTHFILNGEKKKAIKLYNKINPEC